ncbi:hypothetical protein OROMI_016127 [Orobanche minor]
MAHMRFFNAAVFSVLVVLCLLSVSARGQDGEFGNSPSQAPAPAPDAGAGFSTSSSCAFICFSVLMSFVGLLLH